MRRNKFLDQFYTVNPETGDYMIDISIKSYDDIFNSWDSSVYNIRDLDSSLKMFLEDCSRDIDLNSKIALRFYIHKETKDKETEETVTQGMRNYFNFVSYKTRKKLLETRKKAVTYIGLSIIFAVMSFIFQSTMQTQILHQLLFQSLTVGAWVFLWEAFSVMFIQSNDLLKKKKEYKRLLKAPMKFEYNKSIG